MSVTFRKVRTALCVECFYYLLPVCPDTKICELRTPPFNFIPVSDAPSWLRQDWEYSQSYVNGGHGQVPVTMIIYSVQDEWPTLKLQYVICSLKLAATQKQSHVVYLCPFGWNGREICMQPFMLAFILTQRNFDTGIAFICMILKDFHSRNWCTV